MKTSELNDWGAGAVSQSFMMAAFYNSRHQVVGVQPPLKHTTARQLRAGYAHIWIFVLEWHTACVDGALWHTELPEPSVYAFQFPHAAQLLPRHPNPLD